MQTTGKNYGLSKRQIIEDCVVFLVDAVRHDFNRDYDEQNRS